MDEKERLTIIDVLCALAFAIVIGVMVSGCSLGLDLAGRYGAIEKEAKAIDEYCERFNYADRKAHRDALNKATIKGDGKITCEGDPE